MNEKAAPQPSQEFLLRYDTVVRRMAEDLGLPETEVRAALEFKPGKTADCLRPEEVENFDGLRRDRRRFRPPPLIVFVLRRSKTSPVSAQTVARTSTRASSAASSSR